MTAVGSSGSAFLEGRGGFVLESPLPWKLGLCV